MRFLLSLLLLTVVLLPLRGEDAQPQPQSVAERTAVAKAAREAKDAQAKQIATDKKAVKEAAKAERFTGVMAPDDQRLLYVGRWVPGSTPEASKVDTASKANKASKASWTASAVRVRTDAKQVAFTLSTDSEDRMQVVVNGVGTQVLVLSKEPTAYAIDGLDGTMSTVEVVKRTEPRCGTIAFHGVQIDGNVESAPAARRFIEAIGDSITCGYGNETSDPNAPFSAETENGWMTYAAQAARALQADYAAVAWSGKWFQSGMGDGSKAIPDIYDLANAWDPASVIDVAKLRPPDAIILNLGTNDALYCPYDGPRWTTQYNVFLDRLRSMYPKAHVFCTIAPIDGPHLAAYRQGTTEVIEQRAKGGDRHVHWVDLGLQPLNDLGGGWHPSRTTHQRMADDLAKEMARTLGW